MSGTSIPKHLLYPGLYPAPRMAVVPYERVGRQTPALAEAKREIAQALTTIATQTLRAENQKRAEERKTLEQHFAQLRAEANEVIAMAHPKGPRPKQIILMLARENRMSVPEIIGPRRLKALTQVRQEAMYWIASLERHSLPQIGLMFGGRDHTTVMHAKKVHGERIRAGRANPVAPWLRGISAADDPADPASAQSETSAPSRDEYPA